MSYALLFSGQASQHPDMLPWLDTEPTCRPALDQLAKHVGCDWREQLKTHSTCANNAFAQVLITATGLAAWSALNHQLPEKPALVAGYSVGELAAFGCAEVITMSQAIDLASLRAELMSQAVAGQTTGLLSVTGLAERDVFSVCALLKLECAIRIGPLHNLFAGADADLKDALARLTRQGAHATRLEIGVASHSSWMAPAAATLSKALDALTFADPQCPIGLNAAGKISRRPAELRQALSQQLACTVQWSSVMDAVAERQVACVLEVGGGSALSRIWNERHPHIPARALDDFHQPQGAADWLTKASQNNA